MVGTAEFNEDRWREQQLNDHLDAEEKDQRLTEEFEEWLEKKEIRLWLWESFLAGKKEYEEEC